MNPSAEKVNNRGLPWWWAVLAVAVVIRIAYLVDLKVHDQAGLLFLESRYAHTLAIAAASSVIPVDGKDQALPVDRFGPAPGTLAVPAIVYRLGGGKFTIMLFQIAVGLAGIIFLQVAARGILGPQRAWLAALLAALSWNLVVYEAHSASSAYLFTLSSFVLMVLLGLPAWGSYIKAAAAGLALGWLSLFDAGLILLAPLAAGWVYVRGRKSYSGFPFGRLSALILVTALLVFLPFTIRYMKAGGNAGRISSHAVMDVYLANNALADGVHPRSDLLPVHGTDPYRALYGIMVRQSDASIQSPEAAAELLQRSRAWWRAQPWKAAVLMGKRAVLFWSAKEWTSRLIGPSWSPAAWHSSCR